MAVVESEANSSWRLEYQGEIKLIQGSVTVYVADMTCPLLHRVYDSTKDCKAFIFLLSVR